MLNRLIKEVSYIDHRFNEGVTLLMDLLISYTWRYVAILAMYQEIGILL